MIKLDALGIKIRRSAKDVYKRQAWGIAVVHSAFNIAATLILLPFANGLVHKIKVDHGVQTVETGQKDRDTDDVEDVYKRQAHCRPRR